MNLKAWIHYFAANRHGRPEPDWSIPCPLTERARGLIGRSLAHFQLGESGDGNHLFEKAEEILPAEHVFLLQAFIREEQEHARLLAKLVERYGGRLCKEHWSHACFSLIRRALNFDWEIQILMSAEAVGTAFYYHLGRQTADPVLKEVCTLFLNDELQHLAFHAEYLQERQAARHCWMQTLWRWQFKLMLLVVCGAAWLDHGDCMRQCGTSGRMFAHQAMALCGPLLDRAALRPLTLGW